MRESVLKKGCYCLFGVVSGPCAPGVTPCVSEDHPGQRACKSGFL